MSVAGYGVPGRRDFRVLGKSPAVETLSAAEACRRGVEGPLPAISANFRTPSRLARILLFLIRVYPRSSAVSSCFFNSGDLWQSSQLWQSPRPPKWQDATA